MKQVLSVLVLLGAAACSSAPSASTPTPTSAVPSVAPPTPPSLPPAVSTPSAGPGKEGVPGLGNVFVIVGENTSRSLVTPEHAPYLTGSIQPKAAWIENYYALADGSLADYIAMTSGQFTMCDVNNNGPTKCHQNVDNIFNQLSQAGLTWKAWMESATNACDFFDSGTRGRTTSTGPPHNPAVYYDDVSGGVYDEAVSPSSACLSNVVPTGTTAPNDTSALDAALAADGGQDSDRRDQPDPGGDRGDVEFDRRPRRRPSVRGDRFGGGAQDPVIGARSDAVHTRDDQRYSLLRTLEDAFRLAYLAGAKTAPPLSGIWR